MKHCFALLPNQVFEALQAVAVLAEPSAHQSFFVKADIGGYGAWVLPASPVVEHKLLVGKSVPLLRFLQVGLVLALRLSPPFSLSLALLAHAVAALLVYQFAGL